MPYVPKDYQLDSGTIVNSGLGYEIRVAAYLSLHCFGNSCEDIWIASNPKHVDGFDDIVLHRQLPNATSTTYLVQLKHKDKVSDITVKEFLKKPRDPKFCPFYLIKYLEHYVTLTERMSNPENQSEIIRHLGDVKDVKFVLFTNRGVQKCDFLETISDSSLKFLNTNDKGVVYKFKYDSILVNDALKGNPDFKDHGVNRHFFDNLFLFANQVHMQDAGKLVADRLQRVLQCKGFSPSSFVQITDRYLEFMEWWAQGALGGNYPLTKVLTANSLLNIFFESYMVKFDDFNFNTNHDLSTWDEIISGFSVTIVDADDLVYEFLSSYVAYKINQKIEELSSTPSWEDEHLLQSQELKDRIYRFIPKTGRTTLQNIYRFLWLENHLPLVLEIDSTQDYQNIINALKLSNYVLKIIIINKSGEALTSKGKSIKIFHTLQDINDQQRSKVTSKPIWLQGRSSLPLEELVDNSLLQHVTSKDIINILCNTFNIGNILKPVTADFIERRVSRVYLDPTVLNSASEELFVVEKEPEDDLRSLQISDSCNVIIVEEPPSTDYFLKSEQKAVHHLKYDGQLEWKKSHGGVKSIQPYRLTSKEVYCRLTFSSTTIVSACPGMGKSFLIDFLAYQASTTMWVLKIDLSYHLKYYRTPKGKNIDTSALEHLSYFNEDILTKHDCNTKLAQGAFLKFLRAKKVLILMDGFDEISYSYGNEVTNIAKVIAQDGFKVLITTRPHMKMHLEKELNSLSVSLDSFNLQEQKEFLLDYFKKINANPETVEKFILELLEATGKNFNDKEGKFASVPLQIRLLADAFAESCKSYAGEGCFSHNLDLLGLYDGFMEKKMDILSKTFGETAKEDYYMFEQHLSLFALKLLFPFEEFKTICDDLYNSFYKNEPKNAQLLQRGGIVTIESDFNIQFVHDTYAEFVGAKWLAENVTEENEALRKAARFTLKERFNYRYKFLFNVFDRIMAQNSPAHLGIINGDLNEVKKILQASPELADSSDDLNRTLLHMFALYGNYKPSYTYRQHLSFVNARQEGLFEDILNGVLVNRKDDLGYTALDYALANGSLLIAEKICATSNNPLIGVLILQEYKDAYLLFCCTANYKSLFKTLLKYFARNDLLFGKENVDLQLYTTKFQKLQSFGMQNLNELQAKDLYELLHDSTITDVHLASAFGSEDNLSVLLRNGDTLNKLDVYSRTALHYASAFGRAEIVRLILSNGPRVNSQDFNGDTALHLAIPGLHFEVASVLLSNNAAVNLPNKKNKTALQMAMDTWDLRFRSLFQSFISSKAEVLKSEPTKIIVSPAITDIMMDLVDSNRRDVLGAVLENDLVLLKSLICKEDVNTRSFDGSTALHYAVLYGNIETVQVLLNQSGVQVNEQNINKETPLSLALGKSVDVVKLLLNNKSDPDICNGNGDTALHKGAAMGSTEVMSLLLNRTINVEKENRFGRTPLQVAVRSKHADVAILLHRNGADVNVLDVSGNTILHQAAKDGFQEIVSWLTSLVDVNKQNKEKDAAIHCAVKSGHIDIAKLLQSGGADINMPGQNGNTVLHLGAEQNCHEVISWILSLGNAEVNKQNVTNDTPLCIAARKGHSSIAKLLRSYGGDVGLTAWNSNTILHYTAEGGFEDMVFWLLSLSVKVNENNKDNETPLHLAVKGCHFGVAKTLHSHGADINMADSNLSTPLHTAALNGDEEIVSWLLSLGSDVNRQNNTGSTVLHCAVANKHLDIVRMLVQHGALVNIVDNNGNTPVDISQSNPEILCLFQN